VSHGTGRSTTPDVPHLVAVSLHHRSTRSTPSQNVGDLSEQADRLLSLVLELPEQILQLLSSLRTQRHAVVDVCQEGCRLASDLDTLQSNLGQTHFDPEDVLPVSIILELVDNGLSACGQGDGTVLRGLDVVVDWNAIKDVDLVLIVSDVIAGIGKSGTTDANVVIDALGKGTATIGCCHEVEEVSKSLHHVPTAEELSVCNIRC
jgi:hypothetical protein